MSDTTLSMTEALDLIRATAPTDEPTQDAAPAETPVEPPSDVEPAALDDDAPVVVLDAVDSPGATAQQKAAHSIDQAIHETLLQGANGLPRPGLDRVAPRA